MNDLLESLRNPDISSSLFPLLVVTSTLLVAILITASLAAIKVWRILQTASFRKKIESFSAERPQRERLLIYLNRPGRLRRFFQRIFVASAGTDSDCPAHLEEIEKLREEIVRLRREDLSTRDLYAKAVGHIGELEGELGTATRQGDELKRELEREGQLRTRLESKITTLENQLKTAIEEVEKIYEQNAETAAFASAVDGSKEISSSDRRVAEQEVEIRQLKSVLSACRQKMLEMYKRKA